MNNSVSMQLLEAAAKTTCFARLALWHADISDAASGLEDLVLTEREVGTAQWMEHPPTNLMPHWPRTAEASERHQDERRGERQTDRTTINARSR